MRMVLALALLVACTAAVDAASDPTVPPPAPTPAATPMVQFETGESTMSLSNGYGEWHNVYIDGEWKTGRHADYFSFTNATRNGVTDPVYLAGIVLPSSSQTILNIEGSVSPTHIFSPNDSIAAILDHRLDRGWGYQLGARHLTYPTLDADVASVGVDRYVGHYWIAYTASMVSLSNVAGPAFDHRLALTRYYGRGDEHSTTLSVVAGRDVENVNGAVSIYPIFQVDLSGQYWLTRRVGLTYDIFTLRQGALYRQNGVQIGLRARG